MAQRFPRWIAPFVALALALTAGAATRNNDDSCDIGVVPAATLLLPYFEVDLDNPNGEQTIFTITNVTNVDRIARVTLWTDYVYPVVTFNVQLTGYGVHETGDAVASSNWVISSLRAEGRYSVDMDAAPLGNGCSAPAPLSEITFGDGVIKPRP